MLEVVFVLKYQAALQIPDIDYAQKGRFKEQVELVDEQKLGGNSSTDSLHTLDFAVLL
jgi:hypothetical protein